MTDPTPTHPTAAHAAPDDATIQMDPVCGMDVDTSATDLKLEHDGTTYWFCGRGCFLEFRDDPERFLSPDYQPSM